MSILRKYQKGKPLYIADPEEYDFRSKMYSDSLSLYNKYSDIENVKKLIKIKLEEMNKVPKEKRKLSPNFEKTPYVNPKNNTIKPIDKKILYFDEYDKPTTKEFAYNHIKQPIYKKPTQPVTNEKSAEKTVQSKVGYAPIEEKGFLNLPPIKKRIIEKAAQFDPSLYEDVAYRTKWVDTGNGLKPERVPYSVKEKGKPWRLLEDREPGYQKIKRPVFKKGGLLYKN